MHHNTSMMEVMRYTLIPDSHGQYGLVGRMVDAHLPETDVFVFLGDVLNGPDSARLIRLIRELGDRAITIVGNHEWVGRNALSDSDDPMVAIWQQQVWPGYEQSTLQSYGIRTTTNWTRNAEALRDNMAETGDLAWLRSLPPYFETDDFVAVHAGPEHDYPWRLQADALDQLITDDHLIKKVAAEFGLEQNVISLSPETIGKIIEQYTFESGVRQLENTIREIVRKHIAYKASSNTPLDPIELTIEDINKMIEDAHEEEPNLASEDEIGVVNKMSVMNGNIGSVGRLEVVITESGKGEQIVSDNIVGTALSTLKTVAGLLRYRADEWQVPKEIFSDYDIYIHSPVEEKQHDGSSGGVADVICILSAIKNIPIPHTIAFTGAVTLKGKILRIGGVKAKVLAAQRHRMKTIVLPLSNKKDVDELPPDVVGDMEFKYFEDMVDVYDYIFKRQTDDIVETKNAPHHAVISEDSSTLEQAFVQQQETLATPQK